jgi:hypothetical protein
MAQDRSRWSEKDVVELKEMAGRLPLRDLSNRLNRTQSATRVQAGKLGLSTSSGAPMEAPAEIEAIVAPAAIERALAIYQQIKPHDQSVIVQARKVLTQHIYGMVDRGERDEQRLTVGGLIHLKAVEREHGIKSAHAVEVPSSADRA